MDKKMLAPACSPLTFMAKEEHLKPLSMQKRFDKGSGLSLT